MSKKKKDTKLTKDEQLRLSAFNSAVTLAQTGSIPAQPKHLLSTAERFYNFLSGQ